MKCKDCGGEMSFDEINSTGRHLVWVTCFDVVRERERAALARAEAAEAEALKQARRAAQARMRHASLLRRRGLEEPLTTVENEAEAAGLRARVEAAEAEARRESNTAGELLAVIARIGETLGIAMSTPNLCDMVKAEVETVKARAEAAEAERDDLRDANGVLSEALEAARKTLVELTARVAELEAILASDAADENQYLDAYIDSAARDGATIEGLVARVAELEAQAERHAQDYDALYQDYREMRRNWEGTADIGAARYLAEQRVAELEAQLAAQAWRPVTEKPAVTAQYQVALQSGNRRPTADHRGYYEDTGWVGPDVIFWRPIPPLPPAPAPQEPTP